MNHQDFKKLQKVYGKASVLMDKIRNPSSPEEYAQSMLSFEEFDILSKFMRKSQYPIPVKIKSVQNLILLKTNGIVTIPEETIIEINKILNSR